MRVTTGLARGRNLEAPRGMDTRPSSDMTKQAVFNIIQNYVEGSTFLDLFAGSGQMGIEALSRGAKHAVFVDSDARAIESVQNNLKHCDLSDKAKIAKMDAESFLQSTSNRFDLVFMDPPYQQKLVDKVLNQVSQHMSEGGIIICETQRDEELPQAAGKYTVSKTYLYGKAKITVYREAQEEE